ncbi:hypothetical protein GGR55DRAFT_638454 [Xylaria sp. FL0064]|nr:hypothetical protein GGR55DRAFT_638454 [Xylaria sp. FL0064]
MCLKIVTHTMMCDARPVMRHPSNPDSHIVDPFTVAEVRCCATITSKPREGLQCPAHECCQVTVRSFPCGCGNTVGYHRYTSASPPSAYTIEVAEVPSRGVWRTLQSPDDISSPEAHAHPAVSEELQIARWGFKYAVEQLGQTAMELTAASRKKELKEQSLKNGAPYEKQVQAAAEELKAKALMACDVQNAYYTWMHTKEKFEEAERERVSAIET